MGSGNGHQAGVLALVSAASGDWSRVAALLSRTGSARPIVDGDFQLVAEEDRALAAELRRGLTPESLDLAAAMIEQVEARGATLVTVLDDDYPLNLHQVFNRPPFLWVRGDMRSADRRSVAVVGTRQASEWGRDTAAALAGGLSEAGFTVVSGLALGIDTAAHEAALASGGRTIAVVGTGILARTYPAANHDLAGRISRSGAVVSQFWPSAAPRRTTFPLRNVVMSGLTQGTVVVEASATSGARMQARFALEHGKRLFLLDRLVAEQEWARRYAEKPGVRVVSGPGDVLDAVQQLADPSYQMSLTF